MTLRRIITKLIIRVGLAKVKGSTTKEHLPLVMYVERARRKKQNLKERARLLAMLGKGHIEEKKSREQSDSDSESEEEQKMKGVDDGSESEDSDSESESDEEAQGTDLLQSSNRFDIPTVRDIPIVSSLAK